MANREKLPLQIVYLDVNDNGSVRDNIQMKNVLTTRIKKYQWTDYCEATIMIPHRRISIS
jgi:hypothetical protein